MKEIGVQSQGLKHVIPLFPSYLSDFVIFYVVPSPFFFGFL